MALELLDTDRAVEFASSDLASGTYREEELGILREVAGRRSAISGEQESFRALCDRFDSLYFPEDILPGGASHWAGSVTAREPGRSHISVNTPPIYIDLPASLQSVPFLVNVLPNDDTEDARDNAVSGERLYSAWRDSEAYDLKTHRACVVKGLYGRTAGKVWWDEREGELRFDVVDQPRNLWLGWSQSDYRSLDWAAYIYTVTPEHAFSTWGLVTTYREVDGVTYPYLTHASSWGSFDMARAAMYGSLDGYIEVVDYWYRSPKSGQRPRKGEVRPVLHDTWNAIIVGNRVVKNQKHPEYDGRMPYVPLFNTFIPGLPFGRPELYDVEQLIREKDERMSANSQLMNNVVNAQYWQLTGPEAPPTVPTGLRPKANQVIAPGAGNRIEALQPWMPEYQVEAFLSRIDREMVDVTGLNDLLRGLAPPTVMSSSKAISALVANYEARIRMKRDLLYEWHKDIWRLAAMVWGKKVKGIREVLEGSRRLLIEAPSLTPRDDAEAAQIAVNLMNAKLWSQRRAMDRTGVEDPESEQDYIRDERTDATMFPAEVQVLAQLLAGLKNMGYGAPPEAEAMAQEAAGAMADTRALGAAPGGVPSLNGEGETPQVPPEMLSAEGGLPPTSAQTPMAGPEGAPPPVELQGENAKLLSQTQLQGGELSGRILSQVPLAEPAEGT